VNLLITGASGFVGSHLLQRSLDKKVNKVAILLRNPERAWRLDTITKKQDVHIIHGSLNDSKTYKDELKKFSPDVIVNLAWNGVGGSDRNSENQWDNVSYMLEFLNISHQCGAKKFIGFGSQGEYGNLNKKISEKDFEKPTTAYGLSKLSAYKLGKNLAHSLGVQFIWVRLFDPYGPKDGPNWFLSYIIKEFLDGRSPETTLAEQLWDYIYIDDVIDAIFKLLECSNVEGVFNLGSGKPVKLKKIIEKIKIITGVDAKVQYGVVPYRKDQIMHLEANIEKISSQLDWEPIIGIDNGLKKTIDWWRSNPQTRV